MNCVIKIVKISVKKKEVNNKLNTKEGTYGHMSKRLKTIEIVVLKLISPTFFEVYTTTWEISAIWLAESSGVSA